MAERCRSSAALTQTCWLPRHELTAADWVREGRMLGALGRSVGWWLGDWLRYGALRYGERYELASRITGYDRQTLMNMAYVASRVESSRRREKLSFSHHAEVAALPQPKQDWWLGHAEAEELSVRALRGEIRRGSRSALVRQPNYAGSPALEPDSPKARPHPN